MPTITLKNIPEAVYQRLKEAASVHRRSLNSEVLYCMERSLFSHKIDISERLEAARRLQLKTESHKLTDDELNRLKNQGRP